MHDCGARGKERVQVLVGWSGVVDLRDALIHELGDPGTRQKRLRLLEDPEKRCQRDAFVQDEAAVGQAPVADDDVTGAIGREERGILHKRQNRSVEQNLNCWKL